MTHPFSILTKEQFISLTTFRKTGTPVPTPVWFAQDQGKLYVMTLADSGKAKRLSHTSRVEIAPCTVRGDITGEKLTAQAHLIQATHESQYANQILNRKYGIMKRLFDLAQTLGGKKRVYIVITPA